jgi:A/G-specific adenine glycosylase
VVEEFPKRVAKKPIPSYKIATGVVSKGGRFLITQRKPDGLLGGLWEFPGGKIKGDETPRAACVREIKEETNLNVRVTEKLAHVRHAYTHFRIEMDVFLCTYGSGKVVLQGPVSHRWVTLEELDAYPFPKANLKFIPILKKRAPANH